ncbi:MAG TPA: Gfo/Idh/MocA family oxidoreductase [Thermomicrobiales bacterium]|nr:Gfo/Idh/MocA family oxidoreductase [Thermomicrobiales bacterium]
MTRTIRIGIIGTGFGAAHVGFFRKVPGVEVTAIASAQRARAEAAAERLSIPAATDDYRDLLRQDIDAVVIVTPPHLHAPMTLDAVAAGKHVLCEKPMSSSLSDARRMRDAAVEAGVVHMMNHQMRFTPPYARAAELVEDGYIGRLAVADATVTMNPVEYLRLPFWSTSKAGWFTDAGQAGGLLASSAGPHIVDLMRWIGGPIARVAARTVVSQPSVALPDGSTVEITADDGFLALLEYASGAIGAVRGIPVTHRAGIDWTLDLHGSRGSLEVRGDTLRGATAGDDAVNPIDLESDARDDRAEIATRFIDAIRSGGPSPRPNFTDGVAAQAALDACLQAAHSNQWVAVEDDNP